MTTVIIAAKSYQVPKTVVDNANGDMEKIKFYISMVNNDTNISSNLTTTNTTSINKANDDLHAYTCPLCRKLYTDAQSTPHCRKTYCNECIRSRILLDDPTMIQCPFCDAFFSVNELHDNHILQQKVNDFKKQLKIIENVRQSSVTIVTDSAQGIQKSPNTSVNSNGYITTVIAHPPIKQHKINTMNVNKNPPPNLNLIQMNTDLNVVCLCCGNKGHKFKNCPQKPTHFTKNQMQSMVHNTLPLPKVQLINTTYNGMINNSHLHHRHPLHPSNVVLAPYARVEYGQQISNRLTPHLIHNQMRSVQRPVQMFDNQRVRPRYNNSRNPNFSVNNNLRMSSNMTNNSDGNFKNAAQLLNSAFDAQSAARIAAQIAAAAGSGRRSRYRSSRKSRHSKRGSDGKRRRRHRRRRHRHRRRRSDDERSKEKKSMSVSVSESTSDSSNSGVEITEVVVDNAKNVDNIQEIETDFPIENVTKGLKRKTSGKSELDVHDIAIDPPFKKQKKQ